MKRNVISIILIVSGLIGATQTVIPGGYVSGSWDQWGSPYIILDDILIHEDSVLSISGNVEIVFQDTAGLDVYGTLHAIGGNLGTIEFNAEVNTWEGIHIFHDRPDSIIIDHCRISGGMAVGSDPNGGGLRIQNRNAVRISSSEFIGNYAEYKGGAIYLENSDVLMKNSDVVINATSSDSLNSQNSRGGGIYIKDSNPVFTGVLFFRNFSIEGGGVLSTNSTPSFKHCGFQENTCSRNGGAMRCMYNGSLSMEYCEIFDNAAGQSGGAISLYYSVLSDISHVNFSNNGSYNSVNTRAGGAVFIWGCPTQLFENCTFEENSVTDGGGAIFSSAGVDLSGCLFSSNTSDFWGGAVDIYWNSLTAVNCTFSNNTAAHSGTAIFCQSGMVELTNCILWDIYPNPHTEAISLWENIQPSSLRAQSSDIQFGVDNVLGGDIILWDGIIDSCPEFSDPFEDFSLNWNSPCINTGRSDTMTFMIPEYDLNGDPRIMGVEIDMGSYEFQGPFAIGEQKAIKGFSVSPNPSNGFFKIQLDPGFILPSKLEILNISGRILYTQEINSLNMVVHLPQLPDGVYLLKVSGKGQKGMNKIIIKN